MLKRNDLNCLPNNAKNSIVLTKRYEKHAAGNNIQMDVYFLKFKNHAGKKIKRYQYKTIDDASGSRALKVYRRHAQKNAINFVNHVIKKISLEFIPFEPNEVLHQKLTN